MKIGLLTFHRCINYGSYWQARCLLEGLTAMGHDVQLLDHRRARVDWAEWRCALQPTLPVKSPRSDRSRYAAKVRATLRAVAGLPMSPAFAPTDAELLPSMDAVVVGSDEVWNFHHPWYGHERLFFGHGLPTTRLVAHACSFGNYPAARGLDGAWASLLKRFGSISVRDANSQALVRDALDTMPPKVLDPCLQFACATAERRGTADFAIVYGHGFSRHFQDAARRWARRRRVRLVSIGYRNDWADEQRLADGPHGYADAVSASRAVITNFFHGCVFALRQDKPFACEDSPYRSIKVHDLVDTVGCRGRLAARTTPPARLEQMLDEPPGAAVQARIAAARAAANAHLAQALAAPAPSGQFHAA